MNSDTTIKSSDLKVIDRKKVELTGVKKLISFNPVEFNIDTSLGNLIIKGKELEVIKLDTVTGLLLIKGMVNNLNYVDSSSKDSILARLFK